MGLILVPSITLFAYGSAMVAGELTGSYLVVAGIAYAIKWFVTPRKQEQKQDI